jgi:hypothetical protein
MANLITLEDYKISKGLSGVTDDAKITPLLASVSQLVRTYCGRDFTSYYSTDKIEYFTIKWEEDFVQLSETPIVSITSVQEREAISESYVTLSATEYYLDIDTDSIYRVDSSGTGYQAYKKGPASVKVTYKAGYENCPVDLKLAVFDLVTYYLKDEYKQNRSIGSITVQNQTSTTQKNSPDFPDHIKRVLDLYRIY